MRRLCVATVLTMAGIGLLTGCVTVPFVSAILKGDPAATTVLPTPEVDSLP